MQLRFITLSPAVLSTALALLLTSSGCSSDSPKAAAAGDSGPTESCTASLEGECGTCMKASCCDALTACEGDTDCFACVSGMDGNACEKTEETHARVDAYLTCKGGDCHESCIGGDAGATCVGVLAGLEPATCQTCVESNCCDAVAGCYANAGCWNDCFLKPNEAKCHADLDGHALYHAMGECISSKCSSAKCQ